MKDYLPNAGDSFISISETFDTVKIVRCYIEKKDNDALYVAYYKPATKGVKAEYISVPLEDFKGPFFPSFVLRKDVAGLEDKLELYKRIRVEIEEYLIKRHNFSALINEVIAWLLSKGENEEACEIVIKVLIAERLEYHFKKLESGEWLTFSELKSGSEKSKQYYGSLAEEVKVKSEKISLLVSHGQTAGNYREYILRELLKKYVPTRFSVATGFIEDIAKQIDIIIYDAQNYHPTFKEGDLVVIRPEAVRAIIEVKSDLNATTLNESLESFYNILRPGIFKPDLPLFKGIFAFDTDYVNSKSIAKNIKGFYTDPVFNEQLQEDITNDIMYLYHEITCVTVVKKHCLFTKYHHATDDPNSNIIPHLLSITDERGIDIQTALFFAVLFTYLDVDYYSKYSMSRAFSKLYSSRTASVFLEDKLTSDDWFPRTMSQNEHDGKQEKIKQRLDRIQSWFNGDITSTDYIKELHTKCIP